MKSRVCVLNLSSAREKHQEMWWKVLESMRINDGWTKKCHDVAWKEYSNEIH